ncbi:hypothetical protein OG921_26380 [Aldersonia sp. NBC_00410]|uniref:hypothetical protein n=1 Tax=Aldersonia sp. NBC_00410 TaxID=2975954 RepID=UPI0022521766|nr:hypothetical protein [Aldersonia sp. NBC_00410]MCX5046707.1 hypothetical protein [Aldersonia sp. NBC_00410]
MPTSEQLTNLYNATTDYSIREEERARLFDGPSDQNLRLAKTWGAQPAPQYIQFTAAELVGPGMISATGQGHLGGMAPHPVGPIPFVRYNNEWKLSRDYVCEMVILSAERGCN